MSEFHDEYSEALDGEFRKLEDALLSDEVRLLAPSEPVRVSPDTTVAEAVARMVDNRRAAVVIVDAQHHPIGIVTVNDVVGWLARVFPEAILNLRPGDRVNRPAQMDSG